MTGHIDPTKEVFARFRDNDRPGPIHMLNLVRLRDRAAYPDGRIATGAEAYAAYGRDSGPVFMQRPEDRRPAYAAACSLASRWISALLIAAWRVGAEICAPSRSVT